MADFYVISKAGIPNAQQIVGTEGRMENWM